MSWWRWVGRSSWAPAGRGSLARSWRRGGPPRARRAVHPPRPDPTRISLDFLSSGDFSRAVRTYPPLQVTIELLLIGLFVHWVLRFLRGTRGARLLKGIAFVLISLFLII